MMYKFFRWSWLLFLAALLISCPASSPGDFRLTLSSAQLNEIGPGSELQLFVSLVPTGDFAGTVALSLEASEGFEAKFEPGSLSANTLSSQLTLQTPVDAQGSYSLTIQGRSGATLRTAALGLSFTAATQADFSLRTQDRVLELEKVAGTAATSRTQVSISPTNGFDETVDLSLEGLPEGTSYSFDPERITGGTGSSDLTIEVRGDLAYTSYPLSIVGRSESRSRRSALTLSIIRPAKITIDGQIGIQGGDGGIGGVEVSIVDEDGPKAPVTTDENGNFTVTEVQPPYSLTAISRSISLSSATLEGLTLSTPFVRLVNPNSGNSSTIPQRLSGSFDRALPTGHSAVVSFLAEGIDTTPLKSAGSSAEITAGDSFDLSVDLLPGKTITGSLLYLEKDETGRFVRGGLARDITLPSTGAAIETVAISELSLSGTVTNAGADTVSVGAYLRLDDATSVFCTASTCGAFGEALAETTLDAAESAFTLLVPQLEGLSYRVLARSDQDSANRFVATWSEVLDASLTTTTLELPAYVLALEPDGLACSTTPGFSYTGSPELDLYQIAITGFGLPWSGFSSQTSFSLPPLPEPLQLMASSSYTWYPLTAINYRGDLSYSELLAGPDADEILRTVSSLSLQPIGHNFPELVEQFAYNGEATGFTVNSGDPSCTP